MFKAMYATINHDVASMIYKIETMPQDMRPRSVFSAIPQQAVHQEFQAGIPTAGTTPQQAAFEETQVSQQPMVTAPRTEEKVGRNDACPCGSGKKYKKCCGA